MQVLEYLIATMLESFPSVLRLFRVSTNDSERRLPTTGLAALTNAVVGKDLAASTDALYTRHCHAMLLLTKGCVERAHTISEENLTKYKKWLAREDLSFHGRQSVESGIQACYSLLYYIYNRTEQFDKALDAAQRGHRICLDVYGPSHVTTFGAAGRLQDALRIMDKVQDADQVYTQAKAVVDEVVIKLEDMRVYPRKPHALKLVSHE
jgi:tetratricopeptide (TPR) repeat protein